MPPQRRDRRGVYRTPERRAPRLLRCRAAEAGVHVLCEKPMAVSSRDCEQMIRAAKAGGIKQMIAYRLHFDPGNLETIRLVQSGKIGEPRYFTSEFDYELKTGNIRARASERRPHSPCTISGSTAVTPPAYLHRDEPEVFAFATTPDKRFPEIHETVAMPCCASRAAAWRASP